MSSSSKERSLESIRRRKNVKRDKNGPFQFASSSSNEIIGTGGLPPSVTKPKLWAGIPSLPSHALDLQNIKLPKCAPGALLPDFRLACSIRLFFIRFRCNKASPLFTFKAASIGRCPCHRRWPWTWSLWKKSSELLNTRQRLTSKSNYSVVWMLKPQLHDVKAD